MTYKLLLVPAIAALGLALSAGTGVGQDDPGRANFMASCAGCHGADAVGDGEIAKFLSVDVPDLTQLSASNDGVFPMLDVIHIIDGRTGVRGHTSQMPIWGASFEAAIGDRSGVFGSEALVRGHILSLAYYLESIQK